MIVWRITDGKPGHMNQSRGLVAALSRRTAIDSYDVPALSAVQAALYLAGLSQPFAQLSRADLVIGAGHRSHLTLLAAARRNRAFSVVLMRPSLPMRGFDLCLVPAHDAPPAAANVITTRGALNHIRPSDHQQVGKGLILLGGPSAHYDWHVGDIADAITRIIASAPEGDWAIADSRRTPSAQRAATVLSGKARWVAHDGVDADWLPAQLADSATVWVSEDSVSMLYEALSSGARVGLIPVSRRKHSRVSSGIDALLADRLLYSLSDLARGAPWPVPPALDEADRCAGLILERLATTRGEHDA